MKKRDGVFYLWLFLAGALILFGLLGLALALLPYPTLKALGDALSKDGNLQSLTLARYQRLYLPGLGLSLVLLAAGGGLAWQGARSRKGLGRLLNLAWEALARLRSSGRELWLDARNALPVKGELLALLLILAVAVFLRLALINRPMEYDESYTFSEFARYSFRQVMTDYHVPNNHVFHTLLVRCAYLVFGRAPWTIRLPAFLAGVLLVPAVYFLGSRTYSKYAGLAAAAGIAVFPMFVLYSVNARGYTLICLGTVLLLLLGDYVRRKRSAAAWALMALVTALGVYTIPIMLYPFGIVVAWLVLSGLCKDISPAYAGVPTYGRLRNWLGHVLGYMAVSGLGAVLLYAPIFLANGILSVFNGNRVVEPRSLEVLAARLPFELDSSIEELRIGGLPAWVLPLLLVGALLAILLHRRISVQRVSQAGTALAFLAVLLPLQRPIILARVWLFLLTLVIVWGSAGLLSWITILRPRRAIAWGALGGIAALLLWGGARFITPSLAQAGMFGDPNQGDPAQVSRYFKDTLRAGDVVVVSNAADAQYWYYFYSYGIPNTYIRAIKSRPFQHAYIVSPPASPEQIEAVVRKFGPDWRFFKKETLRQVTQIGGTAVYELWPDQEVVDRAYGVKSP